MSEVGQDLLDLENIVLKKSGGLLDLYDRRAPEVLGFLVLLVGDRSTAEDLLVEVFLYVWHYPKRFPSKLTPLLWLMALARDRAVRHLESQAGMKAAPSFPGTNIIRIDKSDRA